MGRLILSVGLAVFLVIDSARAEAPAAEDLLADRVLGDADAPVTIIEYSSLTCPHCASFHVNVLPQIKEAYIDTGKVRLIFRDFPTSPRELAAAAAMVARCVDRERYYGFLDSLFRTQQALFADPAKHLAQLSRFAGLSRAEYDACLNNEALLRGIQAEADRANQEEGVASTPTFLIEDEKVIGAQNFETFKAVIDKALESKS